MKKAIINIILVLSFIAGIVFCAVSSGLQWVIGYAVAFPAMLALVKLNTNWIEER